MHNLKNTNSTELHPIRATGTDARPAQDATDLDNVDENTDVSGSSDVPDEPVKRKKVSMEIMACGAGLFSDGYLNGVSLHP